MLRRMYDWCIAAAGKPHAGWIMGALAFAESSVLPIPPDVMMIPMSLARPDRAWRYATICTLTSVAGGLVGYVIGAALYEEVAFDAHGQVLTASLADYVVPAASEVPPMTVSHLDTQSPSTVGGFRGMGEGGTIGAPAAIANAISDALMPLGIEITELPVTPERLFRLFAQARPIDPGES